MLFAVKWRRVIFVLALLAAIPVAAALDAPPQGQRVFTCAHSFHVFVPKTLSEIATSAGIKKHETLGVSAIGGSQVIRHWDVAEGRNVGKKLLRAGKVDVL